MENLQGTSYNVQCNGECKMNKIKEECRIYKFQFTMCKVTKKEEGSTSYMYFNAANYYSWSRPSFCIWLM